MRDYAAWLLRNAAPASRETLEAAAVVALDLCPPAMGRLMRSADRADAGTDPS